MPPTNIPYTKIPYTKTHKLNYTPPPKKNNYTP